MVRLRLNHLLALILLRGSSGLAGDGLVTSRRRILQGTSSLIISTSSSGVLSPAAAAAAAAAAPASSSVQLSGGVDFPLVSFGLQIYDDDKAYKLTLLALQKGYRNFFASVLAGNQRGFARAVKDSGVPRKDLFICGSVVSNRANGYDAALAATTRGWKQNMGAFSAGNIDYLDQ
jgi:hypothetical protein